MKPKDITNTGISDYTVERVGRVFRIDGTEVGRVETINGHKYYRMYPIPRNMSFYKETVEENPGIRFHFMWATKSWAIQTKIVDALKAEGIPYIRIDAYNWDTGKNVVYCTEVDKVIEKGVTFNEGFGVQTRLHISQWYADVDWEKYLKKKGTQQKLF